MYFFPCVAFLLLSGQSFSSGTIITKEKDEWTHSVILDEKNGVIVKWKNTAEKEDGNQFIVMELRGNTRGYLGLGFSPKGAMTDADIVIGWVDNEGKGHLKDFHGVSNDMPILDESQDYELLSASENESGTTIRFQRKWDTCDENDWVLKKDTTRLIWGFGGNDPTIIGDDQYRFNYHGMNRGTQSVFLNDGAMSLSFPEEELNRDSTVKMWDMTMKNVKVTKANTTYHCTIEKFVDISKKQHLIGWKPIVQEDNVKNVHHINFYECNVPENLVPMFDSHAYSNSGETCFTKNMPPEWGQSCTAIFLVWTIGSEGEMLPEHVGAALGQEHGGATYFMIEMHYENPEGRTFYDNSGIRIYYTDKLRQYDGSILLMGYRHSPFLLIPPQQENFMINGVCSPECFEKTFPATGINIVTTLMHAHLYGKRLRLRHFRNGKELPLIAEDGYYDFNYQQSRSLKPEVTVLPGDELLTECEYDTRDMKHVVLGGLATNQEMCQTFLFYYPKVDVSQCTSQSEFHDFMKGLGIDHVSGDVLQAMKMPYDPEDSEFDPTDNAKELGETGDGASYRSVFDQIRVEEPRLLRGLTVGEHLRHLNWTNKALGKQVEQFWKNGKHYQYCTSQGSRRIPLTSHIAPYPQIKEALPKVEKSTACLNRMFLTNSAAAVKSNFYQQMGILITISLISMVFRF